MDDCEVTMMLRAILASKKDPITLNELKKEYFEANGEDIPFKRLGFATLIKYLESIPNKVKLTNDGKVAPVIDQKIAQLSQLVKGQKKSKKKKNNSARSSNTRTNSYRKPLKTNNFNNNNNYNYFTNNNNRTQQIKRNTFTNSFTRSTFDNSRFESITNRNNNQNDKIPPRFQMFQQNQIFSKFTPLQKTNTTQEYNIKPQVVNHKTATLQKNELIKVDEPTSNWIENAGYFLREHEIMILNILSTDEICLRLLNCDLSKQYDKLMEKMKLFYTNNSKRCTIIEVNQYCVVKSQNAYYRVQIIEISYRSAFCCFVDEGFNDEIDKENIYPIQKEFLDLKFQTITATLHDFEEFNRNIFIKDILEKFLCQKSFIAKRTENKPLKIKLFQIGLNECINDQLLMSFSHFKSLKLTPQTEFYGFVSYFDDRKKMTYIQIDDENRKLKLEQMMIDFNEYFNNSSINHMNVNFNDVKKDKLFCTKYSKDDNWYRVRILRTPLDESDKKILIDFIDYGNEEYVMIDSLREMPNNLIEYKHLPNQALGVIVTEIQNSNKTVIDLLDYEKSILITVNSINNNKIPYVTLCVYEDSKTNTDIEDEEYSEENNENNLIQENESVDNDTTLVENKDEQHEVKSYDNNNNKITQDSIKIDEKVEGLIQKFTLLTKFRNINFAIVEKLHYTQLCKSNLPQTSYVYVTCGSDPSNFTICLHDKIKEYEKLVYEMKTFYDEKHLSTVEQSKLLVDHIYVLKSSNYSRVKFLSLVCPGMAKLYNIDNGIHDVSSIENLYYISDRFTKLPMLALDAKLAYITYDCNEKWSEKTAKYFCSLVIASNQPLRISLVSYQIDTDQYIVDIFKDKLSISQILLAGNYAKYC